MKCFSWQLLLSTIILAGAAAQAQSPYATLIGTVRDTTGARVPAAKITAEQQGTSATRQAQTNGSGEFALPSLPPGEYRITVVASNFREEVFPHYDLRVASSPSLNVVLQPAPVQQSVEVKDEGLSIEPIQTTSSLEQHVIEATDLKELPLAHRSFANIAYLSPMTEPVEPSDPTKARITAVSFAGSSGLNVDFAVDGGDNNDDFIGGFLQNYSPDAMQEFAVRTAQTDADTSRTNGGSVILATRRGTDEWHGDAAGYFRASALNARNQLDNPEPGPKQPFSRQNGVFNVGGPLRKGKLWAFGALEYVNEDASIAYNIASQHQFNALASLAAMISR